MKTLNFEIHSKKKDIHIHFEEGFNLVRLLKERQSPKVLIVTDRNVENIYSDFIEEIGKAFEMRLFIIEPGEKSKEFDVLLELYNEMNDFNMDRSSTVVALGGGVVGDLTGFASSTFLRGVDIIQVPTTVLSQVDSSIGGKTAVNFKGIKNRIGSFYQPEDVLIDTEFLKTLDKREFLNGCGEIIKYGCIMDRELFGTISQKPMRELFSEDEELFREIIEKCVWNKGKVVAEDEEDKGIRHILNFGHTLGHVIEGMNNYRSFKHGEAVVVGMYLITLWSEHMGYTVRGTSERLKKIIDMNSYRIFLGNISKEDMIKGIMKDKKSSGGSVKFILLKDIGECFIKKLKEEEITELVHYIYKREEVQKDEVFEDK